MSARQLFNWFRIELLLTAFVLAGCGGSGGPVNISPAPIPLPPKLGPGLPGNIYGATLVGLYMSNTEHPDIVNLISASEATQAVRHLGLLVQASMAGVSISQDDGLSWYQASRNSGLPVTSAEAVGIVPASNKILVGTPLGLYASTDLGMSFSVLTSADGISAPSKVVSITVYGNNVYVGAQNGLFVSTDGATSFSKLTAALSGVTAVALDPNNPSTLVIGSYGGGLSVSTDGGSTFASINKFQNGAVASLLITSDEHLLVGTRHPNDSEDILHIYTNYTDPANIAGTYKMQADGLPSNLVAGLASGNGTIYMASFRGLATSTAPWNSTITSVNLSLDPTTKFNSVFVDQDGTVVVGFDYGIAIKKTTDSQYQIRSSGHGLSTSSIYNVSVSGTLDLYVCTNRGLGISHDDGQSFQMKTTADGLPSQYLSVAKEAPDGKLYVGARLNGLSISSDGGNTFDVLGASQGITDNNISAIAFGPNGEVYLGTQLNVFESLDHGTSFTLIFNESVDQIRDVSVAADGSVYLATDDGIYQKRPGDPQFIKISTGQFPQSEYYSVRGGGLYDVFAGGLAGLETSVAGSNHFTGSLVTAPNEQINVYDLQMKGGTLVAGTDHGILFSKDAGSTFTQVQVQQIPYKVAIR